MVQKPKKLQWNCIVIILFPKYSLPFNSSFITPIKYTGGSYVDFKCNSSEINFHF